MGYKVLTLSPGSTSTKVAVFDADASGVNVLMNSNVRHDPKDLARFSEAAEQLDYRIETILDELKLNDIDLADIDAFSGYCGGMGPTEGGIFAIDETVCDHVLNCGMNHPAILGAPILHSFATKYGESVLNSGFIKACTIELTFAQSKAREVSIESLKSVYVRLAVRFKPFF